MSSFGPRASNLIKDSTDGWKMVKTIEENIKEKLKMMILTNPGERVFDDKFGVGISANLFEFGNQEQFSIIESRIRRQTANSRKILSRHLSRF